MRVVVVFFLTLKLPFLLHGLYFDLEEVEELGGIGHPEHERSEVGGEFLYTRRRKVSLGLWRATHTCTYHMLMTSIKNTKHIYLFYVLMLVDYRLLLIENLICVLMLLNVFIGRQL